MHRHPVTAQVVQQRAARGIPAHSGDQGGPGPEASQPARGGRGRASLAQRDAPRHIGPSGKSARGRDHNVQHEIAQDHDARRLNRRTGASGGRHGRKHSQRPLFDSGRAGAPGGTSGASHYNQHRFLNAVRPSAAPVTMPGP